MSRNLSIPFIVSTAFTNHNVRNINIINRKLLMFNGSDTPILCHCRNFRHKLRAPGPKRQIGDTTPAYKTLANSIIIKAKIHVLRQHLKYCVPVKMCQSGLSIFKDKRKLATQRNISAANGFVDVRSGVTFK